MSPPALRGLYQGLWGSSWGLAFFLGPALGGWIYEHQGSGTLWAIAFGLGLVLAAGYLGVGSMAGRRTAPPPPDSSPASGPMADSAAGG